MDLFAFHRSIASDIECVKGGVKGIVFDFEQGDKELRQLDQDTEVNNHTIHDVEEFRRQSNSYIICRSNSLSKNSHHEINALIDAGANEILVPMVRSIEEVEELALMINNKCDFSLMIETQEAISNLSDFDRMGAKRFFIGLNDLRIQRGESTIFNPIAEGILDEIFSKIKNTPWGFGGLTLPGFGYPLPVKYFHYALEKYQCDFTFLRRSFYHDATNIVEALVAIVAETKRSYLDQITENEFNEVVKNIVADYAISEG